MALTKQWFPKSNCYYREKVACHRPKSWGGGVFFRYCLKFQGKIEKLLIILFVKRSKLCYLRAVSPALWEYVGKTIDHTGLSTYL